MYVFRSSVGLSAQLNAKCFIPVDFPLPPEPANCRQFSTGNKETKDFTGGFINVWESTRTLLTLRQDLQRASNVESFFLFLIKCLIYIRIKHSGWQKTQ